MLLGHERSIRMSSESARMSIWRCPLDPAPLTVDALRRLTSQAAPHG